MGRGVLRPTFIILIFMFIELFLKDVFHLLFSHHLQSLQSVSKSG